MPHNRAMPRSKPAATPETPTNTCPWSQLESDGRTLRVHDFITTLFSHTSNGLRRKITVPYTDRHGLSVSEWRVMSVLADAGSLPFTELVVQSAADKAQVSRTLQLLAQRDLVRMETLGPHRRHGMRCHITPAGQALYERVMPEARRSQAEMILTLNPDERRVLYSILKRLRSRCDAPD